MPVTVTTDPITTPRTTYRSSVPFETAESRLRSTIQREKNAAPVTEIATAKAPVFETRESFTKFIQSRIGEHGFMHFHEFNHGTWLQAYYPEISGVTGPDGNTKHLRSIRFILGNPLIAQTMLRHDLNTGLSVPIELLLSEEVDGSAKIVQFRPSGLIAGYEGAPEELGKAARILDGKAEALINWVLRDTGADEPKGNL
ncbi:hypothetical protein LTR84_010002 [Exophiala bonariae]|uniref:DUF302 domain-containing protein n=1 Tax=Exophiala bonariae TaxID=1690606 RepID=A0AAV9NMD3_9EURO|nr:hypothetical protein LTR84_010002 [Exophiala bonariae]